MWSVYVREKISFFMDFSSVLEHKSMLFFFVLPILFLMGFLVRSRRKLPYPPGPKGLPIIGNMNLMNQLTHHGLAKLSNQYGGLTHLRLGFLHIVTISTPEMARQILQVQDNIFSNRGVNLATKYLSYNQSDMAFSQYGPFWRQMRKLCVMRLFSGKRAESWASVRDEVDSLVRTVASMAGQPINLGELVFELTMNIIYRAAFGTENRERQEEFVSIMQEFSKLFAAFNMADFIPWLGWIDPQGLNRRLVKARNSLDVFVDAIIDGHLVKRRSRSQADDLDVDTDMVDSLLAFYSEQPRKKADLDDSQGSINLTRNNIKAIIMDVMFGGTETVASVIEWAMAELMKNPEYMKKVKQELEEVVGLDRKIEETDLEKLVFFRCVLKETLRLHPAIPVLIHATAKEAVVEGYTIPKGAHVLVNVWQIGRDKNSWVEPEKFNPSRFLRDGAPDIKGSNFEHRKKFEGNSSFDQVKMGNLGGKLGNFEETYDFFMQISTSSFKGF